MSRCSGCFPTFQPNQIAHMDPGGCMCCDDEFELQPLNLEPQFDAVVEQTTASKYVPEPAVGSECCICLETIGAKNNCVTDCGHSFCFKCLAKSMARSNNCPYCRQPLSDESSDIDDEEEYDSESESEYESSDDEEEEINEDPSAPAHLSFPKFAGNIEEVTRRIESCGYNMLDVVSALYGQYSKKDAKYTNEYANNLIKTLDQIRDDVDNESKESELMGEEDHVTGHHRPHVCDPICQWGCCVCSDTRPMRCDGTYSRYDTGNWYNDAVRRANYCVSCNAHAAETLCSLCMSWRAEA